MVFIIHKIVQEWPLKSTLDPDVYGPPESAITTELVEREIRAFMTIDEVPTFLLFLPRIKLPKFGNMYAGIRTKEAIHNRLPRLVITICEQSEADRRDNTVWFQGTFFPNP